MDMHELARKAVYKYQHHCHHYLLLLLLLNKSGRGGW